MNYALRVWVNDRLEETLNTMDVSAALTRFRAIVAEWPRDWAHVRWCASVNVEPGLFPVRSYAIATYQHTPERTEHVD